MKTKTTEMEDKKIYIEAINKWGATVQAYMTMGECGELTAALNRYFTQNRNNFDEVVEEIADVEIMLEQMRTLFGDGNVNEVKRKKLERLSGIINGTVDHPHSVNIDGIS